jgi:hypothetical protein
MRHCSGSENVGLRAMQLKKNVVQRATLLVEWDSNFLRYKRMTEQMCEMIMMSWSVMISMKCRRNSLDK